MEREKQPLLTKKSSFNLNITRLLAPLLMSSSFGRFEKPKGFLPKGKYEFEGRVINVHYPGVPKVLTNNQEWMRRVRNKVKNDHNLEGVIETLKSTLTAPEVFIPDYGNKPKDEENSWRNSLAKYNRLLDYAVTNSIYRLNVLNRLTGALESLGYFQGYIEEKQRRFLIDKASQLVKHLKGEGEDERLRKPYKEWLTEDKFLMTVIARYLAERALIYLGLLTEKELKQKVRIPIKVEDLLGPRL